MLIKFRSRPNSIKKGYDFFYHDVTVVHQVSLTLPAPPLHLCFPSRNITKNAETHPTPMRDVIIEQPFFEDSITRVPSSFKKLDIHKTLSLTF